MSKANKIKKYEMYDYTGDIIAYCRFDEVESVIKELEQQKSELIATLSMCIDSKRRRLYLKEINETLKKYSGE